MSAKKEKIQAEEPCLKKSEIPINGVTRMLSFKVTGEPQAIEAEAVLLKIHQTFKSEVPGFVVGHRFVCKEHWDVKYFARFQDLDSIVKYMGSEVKTKKVEVLIKEIESLIGGDTHSQNFVADDWN